MLLRTPDDSACIVRVTISLIAPLSMLLSPLSSSSMSDITPAPSPRLTAPKEYTVATHTVTMPSQSFGLLRFEGSPPTRAPSPFVCVSVTTDAEKLRELIMYRWGLRAPRVLISVTGAAKNFDLPPQLDKMLRAGLLRAAKASNAWFLTGGTNAGTASCDCRCIIKYNCLTD